MTIGMTDLPVMTAAKSLGKADCLPILRSTFQRLAQEHPEIIDLLVSGATDAVKDRIKKACS